MKEVWKRQVRQAYPRAKFAFLPDAQAAEGANEVLTQFGGDGYPIEKEVMDKIADKTGATVVSLLVVRNTTSSPCSWEAGTTMDRTCSCE